MTKGETNAKPTVLDWQKPNNTIHNNTEAGFWVGSSTQPKPKTRNVLVRLSDKQGYFSWYFFSRTQVFARFQSLLLTFQR
ncbi:hypothetical protein [Senegalimassilia anaerobia]|uniref:hypothetical protein n=1 Tax=Senegalimassilia anaerobia TaxID=1473216 RepID=UPI002672C955|nr:hypothetical protein [Senegalimassilia anaerobia]